MTWDYGDGAVNCYPANPGSAFVSMSYDTLGRPNRQADANGNVTTLMFAGARTEIDDPGGTARVSYFTPGGKTLAAIEIANGDLASVWFFGAIGALALGGAVLIDRKSGSLSAATGRGSPR